MSENTGVIELEEVALETPQHEMPVSSEHIVESTDSDNTQEQRGQQTSEIPRKDSEPAMVKSEQPFSNLGKDGGRISFIIMALAFQVYIVFRALQPKGKMMPAHTDPLVTKTNIFLGIWNFICFLGGIAPTCLIQTFYKKWTAPPFNYPTKKFKTDIIWLHVVPAVAWFTFASIQIYTTGLHSWAWHRFNGLAILIPVFAVFNFSAMISCFSKLSPLGAHVQFMEILLGLGTFIYFVMGAGFIAFKDHLGHKICMNVLIITALGPGFFRCLRHTRELVTGRLFKVDRYTNYQDLPGTKNLRNFRDVESTYFVLAFLLTDAFTACALYTYGVFTTEKDWLGYFCLGVPAFAVLFGILLRYFPHVTEYMFPGQSQDFNWSFALDYNFPVLTTDQTRL